jgi:hypothetical protein
VQDLRIADYIQVIGQLEKVIFTLLGHIVERRVSLKGPLNPEFAYLKVIAPA